MTVDNKAEIYKGFSFMDSKSKRASGLTTDNFCYRIFPDGNTRAIASGMCAGAVRKTVLHAAPAGTMEVVDIHGGSWEFTVRSVNKEMISDFKLWLKFIGRMGVHGITITDEENGQLKYSIPIRHPDLGLLAGATDQVYLMAVYTLTRYIWHSWYRHLAEAAVRLCVENPWLPEWKALEIVHQKYNAYNYNSYYGLTPVQVLNDLKSSGQGHGGDRIGPNGIPNRDAFIRGMRGQVVNIPRITPFKFLNVNTALGAVNPIFSEPYTCDTEPKRLRYVEYMLEPLNTINGLESMINLSIRVEKDKK